MNPSSAPKAKRGLLAQKDLKITNQVERFSQSIVPRKLGFCFRAKVCPCSSNICQIRLDFTSFVINQPVTCKKVVTAKAHFVTSMPSL